MRTQGVLVADTPQTGGYIFNNAIELVGFSANLVLTRNALGNYSLNRTAAGAETYNLAFGVDGAIKRLLTYPGLSGTPYQVQFGAAAGTAGYPAGAAGMPPFTGTTQLTAPTGPTLKGIRVTDVFAVYQVGVADLTSAALSLNRTAFANNVAPAITNVPIAATALPLTFAGDATGPYVVTRAVTTPVFETTDLSDLVLDFQFVMANTGTIKVWGLGFHVDFNYN